ncbi:alpha/beta hydrolase [Quadrisphaera sp. KR29]|uniref:alpha/beta hydrolase n=1 Tax=Quadrisphaera sp. KR29 TaxID=3461391 RepID=UPI00404498C2
MKVSTQMIAPELRTVGRAAHVLFGGGQRTEAQLRRKDPLAMRLMARLTPRGVEIQERSLTRTDGTALDVVVVTRPGSTARQRPGILWLHGGGYSAGSHRGELVAMKHLLDLTDAVVVSPDYRLSKQAPYPAAVDDCYQTLLWLKQNASDLGVRSDQLIVAGGSAGGGLTAATTLMARQRGEVRIAFQMPLYPMLDDRTTPSSRDNDAPVYDAVTNDSNWRIYLGELYGTASIPSTAAPARETDYSDLPPTITFVGSIEPFRDETVTYVENLRAAGVPVAFLEVEGAWHGFDSIASWTKVARRANAWRDEQFKRFLTTYFAPN